MFIERQNDSKRRRLFWRRTFRHISARVKPIFGIVAFILLIPVIFFLRWAHGTGPDAQ